MRSFEGLCVSLENIKFRRETIRSIRPRDRVFYGRLLLFTPIKFFSEEEKNLKPLSISNLQLTDLAF